MAFTAEEVVNIANTTIELHIKGQPESQIIQDRPLYNDLVSAQVTFGGGNGIIDGAVKGQYSSAYQGYTHDDENSYVNPANVKRWSMRWSELHAGISFTMTELKLNGIHVVDSNTGEKTTVASDQEKYALANLLEDKIEDLKEGSARSHAEMCWRDGTQDSKVFPGITSFILKSPNSGMSFGLDRSQHWWWRNRAVTGIDSSTPSNLNIINTLQKEMRQLRRYGSPKHKAYAGSDFLDMMEKELRSKGTFVQEGWAKSGRIDASIADLAFKGVEFQYDPLLDDLGESKSLYLLDMKAIKLMVMEGEDKKMHFPSRPPEKYVFYRAITWTGGMRANRLNTSGVYTVL